jgi:hypothetical protein
VLTNTLLPQPVLLVVAQAVGIGRNVCNMPLSRRKTKRRLKPDQTTVRTVRVRTCAIPVDNTRGRADSERTGVVHAGDLSVASSLSWLTSTLCITCILYYCSFWCALSQALLSRAREALSRKTGSAQLAVVCADGLRLC